MMRTTTQDTRWERGSQPDPRIVYKWFAAKKATGWQVVKAIKWWRKQDRSNPLVCFPQKTWKNAPIINDDGEHTRNIVDGVSL